MNAKRSFTLSLIVLILFSLAGCGGAKHIDILVFDLNEIDKSYKQEFSEQIIPRNSDGFPKADDSRLFFKTLNLTDKFIKKYKRNDKEIAHVKVLQSLMHLQREDFDEAKLAIKLAQSYQSNAEDRDRILINSLPHVISGWEASKENGQEVDKLRTLISVLGKLDKQDYNKLSSDDEVYLYLTAVRAIFHYNKGQMIGNISIDDYRSIFGDESGDVENEKLNMRLKEFKLAVAGLEEVLNMYLFQEEMDYLRNASPDELESIKEKLEKGERRFVRYKALYVFLMLEKRNLEKLMSDAGRPIFP